MSFQGDAFQQNAFQVEVGSGSPGVLLGLVPYDAEPNKPLRRVVQPIWDRPPPAPEQPKAPPGPPPLPPAAIFDAPAAGLALPSFDHLAPDPGLPQRMRDAQDMRDVVAALTALKALGVLN